MRCSSALSIVLVHSFLLSSAVAAAPAQSELPTPESVLGFRVGADFKLATYDESIVYFQQLAQASDRVVLLPVGRTSEGKLWYMALISSPANLAQVDRYREIARRLASPGDLDDEQARALAREGKAIVHIDGGLHATEVAHAQHTIELAYELARSDEPAIERILDEVSAWDQGGEVRFVPGDNGGSRYQVTGLSESAIRRIVSDLALQAERGTSSGARLNRPRVGLYRSWTASMDEGWTRWILERYEFEFDSLCNAAIRAGGLRARYDVIVLPSLRADSILEGRAKGTAPARYAGGIGKVGVRGLQEFVRAGGTLVCLNASSLFASEQLDLPVENAVADLERAEFFSGVSLLRGQPFGTLRLIFNALVLPPGVAARAQ